METFYVIAIGRGVVADHIKQTLHIPEAQSHIGCTFGVCMSNLETSLSQHVRSRQLPLDDHLIRYLICFIQVGLTSQVSFDR